MHTRVYQGRKRLVPEDYHGTAFAEEIASEAPLDEVPTQEAEIEPAIEQAEAKEQEQEDERPHSAQKENGASATACTEQGGKTEGESWSTELLLLALAALLVQNDVPDVELILVLMFLLLSPTT